MNLTAIVLLCQIYTSSAGQLACQKLYITCWNIKRQEQLKNNSKYDGDKFLAECILESK